MASGKLRQSRKVEGGRSSLSRAGSLRALLFSCTSLSTPNSLRFLFHKNPSILSQPHDYFLMATSPSLRPVTPPNASDAAAEVQNSPVPVKSAHLELQRHVSSQKPQSHPQQQQKTTEDALARKAQASSAKDIYSLQDRELAARYCFQCMSPVLAIPN